MEPSNALSYSIRSKGKAEPVATVKRPQSVSVPNWRTSDEQKPVCTMKIALKCTLYVKISFNIYGLHIEYEISCFQYKIDCRVTIELLDTESDDNEKNVAHTQKWSSYMERMSNPATGPSTAAAAGRGSIDGATDAAGNTSTVEIKTETLDDDMVSRQKLCS